jgi:hypothetical protein
MAKNVQLTIDIKGNDSVGKAAEATKNLKTQLRELQNDLQSGKLTGKAFDEGIIKAGKMKDQIKDVNNRVNALATDGADVMLKGFGDMATGIIGGFTAAQGAMALFGDENEDLQKTMVKLQGATALLNGLQAVNNTLQGDSAAAVAKTSVQEKIATFVKGRYAAAIGKSTGAMKLFRIAGMALGIGAVIAIISLLINNFDKLRNIVLKFVPQLAGLGEVFTNVKNAIMDFLGFSSEAERQQEKSIETDKAKSKSMQREIDLMEAQGASVEAIYKKKKELMELDLKALKIAKEKAGASQEETDAYEDALNAIAVLDAQETKRKQDLVDKENQEASKKRTEQAKKKKEEEEKIFDDNKKTALQRAKDLQNDLLKKFDDEQKALKDDKKAKQDIADESEEIREQKEIEANQKYGELIEQRRIDDLSVRDKELFDISEKYRKEQELALGNADLLAQIQTDKDNALREKKLQFDAEDAALQQEADNVRIEQIAKTAEQAGQLINQLAGKNKAAALTALALEKGAAIANVIVSTQREIAAYRANPTWSLLPDGGAAIKATNIIAAKVRAGISIASISAAGLSGAKNITGGGSGGGSVQPPNIRGSQTSNEPTQQPATKVFVTETDIRSVTRKVDGIFTQATIQ